MTLKEILKAQGLTDEQIEAITKAMSDNKVYTAGEENLDIRYGKLKEDYKTLEEQHGKASDLIEQMKKDAGTSEELKGKISEYETTIASLNEQLKQTQLDAAIKVALLGAKATDVDYMTFKLKEKGDLALDKDGGIKGIDDMIAGLKTQFPNQFESAEQKRHIDPNPLPNGGQGGSDPAPKSLAEALKQRYETTQND